MKDAASLIFGSLFCLPSMLALAAPTARDADAAIGFLRENCVSCHGAEKQKGDVRLDTLAGDVISEGTQWQVVVDQIRSSNMPPEDAKKQPAEAAKRDFVNWVVGELGAHAQVKPNLGNLVPHELLFGPGAEKSAGAAAPAPRLWRLSPEGYLGWASDAGGDPKLLVQPFTANPERGIKDFATLGRIDEPTTEILMRNAEAIVERQLSYKMENGQVKGVNGSVREFYELILPGGPEPTREMLEKAIQRQFFLAIARTAAADEVERLLGLYETCAMGGDRAGAIRTMLTAVLLRSDALFRSELGGPDGRLTQTEIAAAISASLTNRRDRQLFDAAAKGELATREQLEWHIRRILDDSRQQKPRVIGFFREYFEYDNATEVFKDEPKDLWHRPDQHVMDTDRLVLYIVGEDKDVFRQLLTTPLTFANVTLKENKQTRMPEVTRNLIPNAHNQKGKAVPETLYGMDEWHANQPFEQKSGTRLGILMQPSWLVAWSENFNNDIVRRGRFIRERLLGGTVPDLPIGVAAMIPNEPHRTLRDRVTNTTSAAKCWKCHQHMDDLGLPFENFDHFGRLLAAEPVLDPEATAKNVDKKGQPLGDVFRDMPLVTSGKISLTGDPKLDGPIKDPRELVTRLANSDRCRQVWIRHAFRYYLGRNETMADAATLQAADRAYLDSGGSFQTLLVSLLTSDSFLSRAPQTQLAQTPEKP